MLPGAGRITILHAFDSLNDGDTCTSQLVLGADVRFYSVTQRGGTLDRGAVFSIDGAP